MPGNKETARLFQSAPSTARRGGLPVCCRWGLLAAGLLSAGALFGQNIENSTRVHDLIRAGNLYLSLQDALALAIENNLDIELQRYAFPQADAELLRSQGGGTLRGINFTLAEVPTGVGGPLSPVETGAAVAGRAANGISVASSATELGVLGEPQDNFSILGTVPQSAGTAVPSFDPAVAGLVNFTHQSTPQTSLLSYGTNALVTNTTTANAGIESGFSTGATGSISFDNSHTNWNSQTAGFNPFNGSSLGITLTQPLLRGAGRALNRRYIRIAGNERKITSLLFQQQLINTTYGVVRLYTDYVALYEDEKVKQETLTLAQKLLADTKAQVEIGTLAVIELTRANAQVASAQLDLINARGLREEEEAIVKTVLTRRNDDPELRPAHLIPTDTLSVPEQEQLRPEQDLMTEAVANRPDVAQAQLQVENSQIGLAGSRSATLPEVDLVGVVQNNGLAGANSPGLSNGYAGYIGGYGSVLEQIFARNYPTYGVGVQVTLPIHNRVAEADLARDEIQVKQQKVRVAQLQNQARLEVQDALIAMRRARASYQAAEEARRLQQESLEAEQAKFEIGTSTSFFVIQYQSLLAQAKSTEIAAQSSYVKARAALQRATGSILDQNHISFDDAIKGKM
ncbi:MAG TPA: TolC family protein [Bryobacteraceae bacterium]|jgi:outer membrane protein TolC|nr:TolC family protein [Bryobacteraceae bacterium]